MKKISLVLCISFGLVISGLSQNPVRMSEKQGAQNNWYVMMQDPDADFYETQRAFYRFRDASGFKMTRGIYKIFKRWEYFNQFRANAQGIMPSPSFELDQYQDYCLSHPADDSRGSWSEVGPLTYPVNETAPQPTGMGRINAIAFQRTNPDIIYAGAPSGGIWKTVNGGAHWDYHSGNLPTIGVSALVVDPNSSPVIYAGTGDRDANDAFGTGIYKSFDGGVKWVGINNGIQDNTIVGMMIMNPFNSNMLLAATSTGIYKTIDGGAYWERKKTDACPFKDIKYKPGNPSVVYATACGKFFLSTDTGNAWNEIILPVTGTRLVIGVSQSQPNTVYVCQTEGVFKGLLRSTQSGLNFTVQSTAPLITGYACLGGDLDQQSNYDLCMTVDPNDANLVFVGAINVWKSVNAGVNWSIAGHWNPQGNPPCENVAAVHADHHTMEWSSANGKLYLGNDGGVYYTSNKGVTWNEISNGLGIAQIYRTGQSATLPSLSINGFQDNGTGVMNNGAYSTVIGGDGMDCFIDYSDTSFRWGSYCEGDIYRKASKRQQYEIAAALKFNGVTDQGGWVTPYVQHVRIPSTVFMGRKNVWRSINTKVDSVKEIVWRKISALDTLKAITAIEQSRANPGILYAVRTDTLIRSDNVNAETPS